MKCPKCNSENIVIKNEAQYDMSKSRVINICTDCNYSWGDIGNDFTEKKYSKKFAWGFGRKKKKKKGILVSEYRMNMQQKRIEDEKAKAEKEKRFVKTYTFEPTGILHDCKFTAKSRQYAIIHSRVGNPVSLRVVEWQGEPAIAIINDKLGYDIGMAKATKDLPRLLDAYKKYDIEGTIQNIHTFEYKGEEYLGVEVMLKFYEKEDNNEDI